MNGIRDRLRQLGQAIRLVWGEAPGWTLVQSGLILLQGVLPVALLVLMRRAVDAAAAFLAQSPDARDPRDLALWLAWMAAVLAAGWGCRALSGLATDAQAELVSDHVQDALQRKSVNVDFEYFETSAYHDQMKLAQAEAATRPASIVRNLVQLACGGVVLAAVAGVLGASQGWLLPVLLAAALPGMAARMWNARRWNRWRMDQSMPERYAGYLHLLLTALPFAKEIRLSGNGGEIRRQHRDLRRRLRKSRRKMMRQRAAAELLADLFSAAAVAAGAGIFYLRMRHDALTLGDLALLFGAFQKGKSAFAGVTGSLAALYEDSLFLAHFHAFLGLPSRVRSPAHPRPMPQRITQGLQLENVSFRYPGTERDVLIDINAAIPAGRHLALVGENGSGKTTLVKLLCRLYDPVRGRILLDGIDIREFALEDYRAAISVLFQDFVRYQMTAGENIRMGDVGVPPDDRRIGDAAQRTGAATVIDRLPGGYGQRLGRLFPDGAELSEGQWQRVALARCFLRQASMVFLDEPTSALDAKAERRLLASVLGNLAGRTAVVVSHRLSTVQAADRILVLVDGRMAESGSHAQLVQAQGPYAALFAVHGTS